MKYGKKVDEIFLASAGISHTMYSMDVESISTSVLLWKCLLPLQLKGLDPLLDRMSSLDLKQGDQVEI